MGCSKSKSWLWATGEEIVISLLQGKKKSCYVRNEFSTNFLSVGLLTFLLGHRETSAPSEFPKAPLSAGCDQPDKSSWLFLGFLLELSFS